MENKLREKIDSWLGKELKIILKDKREIYGVFVCVDKSLNFILKSK
jgi:small nuclear ribonucleoprotein (snRNP)-like protein